MATREAKPKRIAGAAVVLKGETWVRDVANEYNVLPATVKSWKKSIRSSKQQGERKRAPGGGRKVKISVVRD
jgi:uncharacterized protein YjcR